MTNEPELKTIDPALIPQPVLWRILVQPITAKDKTDGGIILADQTKEAERYNNCIGKVLAMGPLAYTGDRFKPHPEAPPIPACKVGDWITMGKYAGQNLMIDDVAFTIINDDEVTSVVTDPSVFRGYI